MSYEDQTIAELSDELAFWRFYAIYQRAVKMGASVNVEDSDEWSEAEKYFDSLRSKERT